MYTSLVQIAGGLFGIGIAYAMYYFVERRDARIEAEIEARHQAEIRAIKLQTLKKI
jgi:hypothetical protein